MKYAIVLAFGAAAYAQNITQSPTQSCVGVVTETYVEYFYSSFCPPCNSTTSTPATSSLPTSLTSSGSVSTTVQVGTDSSDGPILTSSEGTSSSGASTTASGSGSSSGVTTSPQSAGSTSSSTSATTTVAPPPSTSASTTTAVVSSTTISTTTAGSAVPSPVVPPAGTTQVIPLSSLPADYIQRALYAHNLHRANASIPLLVWNSTIATYAQQLGETCVYGHSRAQGDGNYGQNIGAGFLVNQVPAMITNNMYDNEINFYPGPYGSNTIDESNFSRWGHYSQLVWTDTTSVGCATVYCPNGLANTGRGTPPYFTVCNYYPPGNFVGAWSRVATPGGGGTVVFTAN